MERNRADLKYLMLFILFLLITKVRLQDPNERGRNSVSNQRACAYVQCENNDTCVHRKFRCKDSSCPSMLYCAKSRTDCKQQIARCVSRREYHEGPASCAGFKCVQGSQCILRESFCKTPPCKLLRSCAKNKEVHIWFSKCRSLGCPSEFECFLRRPEYTCSDPPCKHTPDCTTTTEDEVSNDHCRGWICPRTETCSAEIIGSCDTDDCNVNRTCQKDHTILTNHTSSLSRRSLSNKNEYTVTTETHTETSRNASQQNVERTNTTNEVASVNKTCLFGCRMANRASQLWLDRSNSNAELNAIQFWVKNIEEQKDFKNIPPQENWYKERGEMDSFLRGRNFTDTVDELLIPNKILLPPYTALETIILNSLRESNHFPFLDFVLKYPVYKGDRILPSELLNVKDAYKYPSNVPPVENTEDPANSQSINRDPNFYRSLDQYEMPPQSKTSDVQEDAFPFAVSKDIPKILRNSSSTEDGLSSLWTESNENLEKASFYRGKYFIEDSDSVFENEILFDKTQNHDDVSISLLEKLIKALSLTSAENPEQNFKKNEENRPHEKDSRTPGLIYEDEEPTFRSSYNIPNYGTGDDTNIAVEVHEYNTGRKGHVKENNSQYEGNMKYKSAFYYKK